MDLFNPGPLRRLFGDAPDSQPDVSLNRADSVWLAAPRRGALTGKRASREPLCWG